MMNRTDGQATVEAILTLAVSATLFLGVIFQHACRDDAATMESTTHVVTPSFVVPMVTENQTAGEALVIEVQEIRDAVIEQQVITQRTLIDLNISQMPNAAYYEEPAHEDEAILSYQ